MPVKNEFDLTVCVTYRKVHYYNGQVRTVL